MASSTKSTNSHVLKGLGLSTTLPTACKGGWVYLGQTRCFRTLRGHQKAPFERGGHYSDIPGRSGGGRRCFPGL